MFLQYLVLNIYIAFVHYEFYLCLSRQSVWGHPNFERDFITKKNGLHYKV